MRNNTFLKLRLEKIWSRYFLDLPKVKIAIKFGRFARLRLGSIKFIKNNPQTVITITAMFKNKKIPISVIDHTIAHELVHFAHGFSSNRVRLFKYPHAGGIVKKEMLRRGMGKLNQDYQRWVKSR